MVAVVDPPYTAEELARQQAANEFMRKYEEERKQERKARMELQQEVNEIMAYVAEKMGEEYGVEPNTNDSWCPGGVVKGVRGHGLHFTAYSDTYYSKPLHGKLTISLSWGQDGDKAYFRDVVKEINVSRSKGAEKIWKDIERRLLPQYLNCREQVRASVRQELDREATLKDMAEQIAKATGGTYKAKPWDNGSSNKYEWYIEGPKLPYSFGGPNVSHSNISVYMNQEVEKRVHLEVSFRDFEEALEVLALLAAQVQQQEVVDALKERKSA